MTGFDGITHHRNAGACCGVTHRDLYRSDPIPTTVFFNLEKITTSQVAKRADLDRDSVVRSNQLQSSVQSVALLEGWHRDSCYYYRFLMCLSM